ncbi:MAG: hypothetical protein PUP91_15925 [Rhizonema sp. PD37]|nr:hypothetical protein [Rhizonema sp. PD37]
MVKEFVRKFNRFTGRDRTINQVLYHIISGNTVNIVAPSSLKLVSLFWTPLQGIKN